MNQITQFFSNLKADFDRLNQSIDDLVKSYNAIVHFLDLISNLFPMDLVLVLAISIPILYIINTLSPSSPRINYTISVLSVSALRSFLTHAISDTWNLFQVSKTALLLLFPAYSFFLFKILISLVRKYRVRKKALSPRNLSDSFLRLQNAYHSLSAEIYSSLDAGESKDFVDGDKFLPKIKDLEESIAGLKKLLVTPSLKNEKSLSSLEPKNESPD